MIHSATNVRKLALTFTPSLWWVRTCGIFRWAWSSTSTWTTATKQTMESKSVRYMMILILCQRRQWPHHLFFGVNLRSGLGGGGRGRGSRGGETEREEGPSDCRLFRYWFEHGRSRNIVKLLFIVYFVSCRYSSVHLDQNLNKNSKIRLELLNFRNTISFE